LKGPNLALGAATAGGGIALATAMNWLRRGKADAVLVGGSESFSLLNVLGFDQLGLSSADVCTPFSGEPGMTFGEGAGYLFVESLSSAQSRGAAIHAILAAAQVRADGFDPILFNPSGGGLSRAIQAAIRQASLAPEGIDWIRASGTGGRDQDLAETLAVKAAFDRPPPVSSLEPQLGHANGACPTIGLVAAALCLENNLIPQTLGCTDPRQGCDLDYVAEAPRETKLQNILCNTMAFGGTNCAMVLQKPPNGERHTIPIPASAPTHSPTIKTVDEVVITGIGVISPMGCGSVDDIEWHENATCFSSDERLGTSQPLREAGLVRDFSARKYCPKIKLRGTDLLTQYAAAAVSLALNNASVMPGTFQPENTGLVSAITRPSGQVFSRLMAQLQEDTFRPSTGRLMLRNGRFMVASQLAQWFDLKGHSASISLGAGSGLHGLCLATDQLLSDASTDAMLVVASDELSPMTVEQLHTTGVLVEDMDNFHPFCPTGRGLVPGEGAIALVLERRSSALSRGARTICKVRGASSSFDAVSSQVNWAGRAAWEAQDPQGTSLSKCVSSALENATTIAKELYEIFGLGCGDYRRDIVETTLVSTIAPSHRPRSTTMRSGLCESSSALFNLAAAASSLNQAAADTGNSSDLFDRPSLVFAPSDQGHNAAVVIGHCSS